MDQLDYDSGDNDDVQFLYETSTSMSAAVAAVESLLGYKFRDRILLEEALTHSSYAASPSYERLEFLGNAALDAAVSNHIYFENPDLHPGQLSLLRSANVSTERLARVAVRHRLYRHVRHNVISFGDKITEFEEAVEKEDVPAIHGGAVKAPKMLADIVESVAGAVYVDCGLDLKLIWEVFRALLEPLVTFNELLRHPQPVTMLFQLCQKQGKQATIKLTKNGDKDTAASVFVEGKFVASSSSYERKIAKLNVAKLALRKLSTRTTFKNHSNRSMASKEELNLLCSKKKWLKPIYKVENKQGPPHKPEYLCSVKTKAMDIFLYAMGEPKSRIRDAESSAAECMLCELHIHDYLCATSLSTSVLN